MTGLLYLHKLVCLVWQGNSHGLILATGGTQEIWEIIFLFEKDFVTLQANNNHEDRTMNQEARWLTNYKKVWDFIETNHRNPSKHRVEDYSMVNWLKVNKKLLNAGKLKSERVGKFKELLELKENNKRKNQFG